MAFDISNLALVSHGNNRKVYSYTSSADTLATIKASGYFGQDSTTGQQASNMLDADDIILCKATDGHQQLRVDTVSGTTVTTEVGSGETAWISAGIATLSTSGGIYIAAPFDGAIVRGKVVTNGEVDTTTVVTVLNASGAAALTIALDASGQGAGEVYEASSTANGAVSEGDAIQITWDGAATAAANANEDDAIVMVEFVPN